MNDSNALTEEPFSENTPDAQLVLHAVSGNNKAFETIMRRHNRVLFRTARSIVNNDEDAEDVLQEAYLHAWRAMNTFRGDARLSTWLVRIVVNEALGRLRHRGAQIIPLNAVMNSFQPENHFSLTENPDLQPDWSAMRSQLRRILEARIDGLPEMYRTIFMLRAVEEMSNAEVSEVLQIPEATVRTRFFRARSLLREAMVTDIDATLDDAFLFDGERCDRIVGHVLAKI